LKKNVTVVIVCVGLILIIGSIALLAISQIAIAKTTHTENSNSWEISEPFQKGETAALDIKAAGDWGSFYAGGSSQTFPVQLNVTFQASSGGEASFSCWYNATTMTVTGGVGTPVLTPINATVIENNASQSLEPVSNDGEASCLVETDVNVTASLDQTSVVDAFGPVNARGIPISPPHLSLLTDLPSYPYPYLFLPGLILVTAGLLVFAFAVYETSRRTKRRKIRR
jgi:hypothetical protein